MILQNFDFILKKKMLPIIKFDVHLHFYKKCSCSINLKLSRNNFDNLEFSIQHLLQAKKKIKKKTLCELIYKVMMYMSSKFY